MSSLKTVLRPRKCVKTKTITLVLQMVRELFGPASNFSHEQDVKQELVNEDMYRRCMDVYRVVQ